jgi:large subunit ribosomal protein L17
MGERSPEAGHPERITFMSDRSRDGVRIFVALLVGVMLGIVVAELARRLGPRVALAPGHPLGPQVREAAPGSEAEPAVAEEPDSLPGNGTHDAPDGYPVKGNQRSGIYHVPGGFAYDRTIASIFFRSPEAAERAGYRAAKA